MKRPALLRAFCGQWIAEWQSSDLTQAARFAGGGQILLTAPFFSRPFATSDAVNFGSHFVLHLSREGIPRTL
jgi:hypothetical protein